MHPDFMVPTLEQVRHLITEVAIHARLSGFAQMGNALVVKETQSFQGACLAQWALSLVGLALLGARGSTACRTDVQQAVAQT